jgi:folate-binding protein YgfZ
MKGPVPFILGPSNMAEVSSLFEIAKQAGARFAEEFGWTIPVDFGDPVAEYDYAKNHAALFDVSSRSKVEVTGADAGSFLNNLCTNDVKNLAPGAGCEAFFTTIKAKVVAHVMIFRPPEGGSYWLDAVPGQSDKIIKHLDHFLISEQVEFTDQTREYAQIRVAGPDSAAIMKKTTGVDLANLPANHLQMVNLGAAESLQVRRYEPLGLPGFDLLGKRTELTAMWGRLLEAGVRPAGSVVYHAMRIEAGTPWYGLDIDENTLAPEVNRIPQTICYTKGCYLGQEPIVRARDIGHVNRTLHGLGINSDRQIEPGTKLIREGKDVGHITSAAKIPGKAMTVALAYVRRGNTGPGTELEIDGTIKATILV